MDRSELKLHQRVWVIDRTRRLSEITAIGRLLVIINSVHQAGLASRGQQFRIDTQRLNGDRYGNGVVFRTFGQQQELDEHAAVRDFFSSVGIRFDTACKISQEHRKALADQLERWGYG